MKAKIPTSTPIPKPSTDYRNNGGQTPTYRNPPPMPPIKPAQPSDKK